MTDEALHAMTAATAPTSGLGAELQTASTLLSDRQVEDLVRTHYGLSGKAEWLWGEKDSNHRLTLQDGSTCLVKVLNAGEKPETTSLHSSALLHVAHVDPGIPVQRIVPALNGAPDIRIPTEDGDTRAVRLVTFLHGQALSGVRHTARQRANVGIMMARMQKAFESFEHACADHKITWDMTHAPDLAAGLDCLTDEAERDRLAACLTRFKADVLSRLHDLPTQVIHNDFNCENILVDPDKPDEVSGIIDFGDMVRAPRVFDVAVGASYMLDEESEPVDCVFDMLAGYATLQTLNDAEIAALYPAMMVRTLMRIVIPHWRASMFAEHAARILCRTDLSRRIFARLSAYCEDEFAARCHTIFMRAPE